MKYTCGVSSAKIDTGDCTKSSLINNSVLITCAAVPLDVQRKLLEQSAEYQTALKKGEMYARESNVMVAQTRIARLCQNLLTDNIAKRTLSSILRKIRT